MFAFLKRLDVRVCLIYGTIAALWIIASDSIFNQLFADNPTVFNTLILIKNSIFIVFTSLILFVFLSKRQSSKSEHETHRFDAYDTLIEGVQIIDHDWRYLYLNASATQHSHYSPGELIGYTMMEKYPGIEASELFAIMQSCMTNRVAQQMENEFVYPDGSQGWFELSIQPVPEGIFILSLDITQRKLNALARQEIEERYKQIVEDQTDAICRYDTHFNITYTNLPYAQLYGKNPDELIGTKLIELIPVEKRQSALELISNLTPKNPVASHELSTSIVDDTERWIHWTDRALLDTEGNIIEYQAVGHDITELKKLQLEQQKQLDLVEEMRQFLRATLDAIPANTVVLDTEGVIISVNKPWKVFADANQSRDDSYYVGVNYLNTCDAVTPQEPESDIAKQVADGIRSVISGEADSFYLEYPCHSPHEQRWFGLRVTHFDEPTPRRVVVAHLNITERKQVEEAEYKQRILAETLRDSLAILTGTLDVEKVLEQILILSANVIPGEAGTIIQFEGNKGRVTHSRGYSPEAEAFFRETLIPFDSGSFADDGKYYIIYDTLLKESWTRFPQTDWIRSSIGVPIELRGHMIGLLIADSAIPNQFQQQDLDNLEAFAQYAALALETAYHIRELERRVNERTLDLLTALDRVEAILNNSPDAFVLLDADFKIQQTNRAFNELFTSEPEGYLGTSLTILVHEDHRDTIKHLLQSVIDQEHNERSEFQAMRKEGEYFDAEIHIGKVTDNELVCVIHDISERITYEKELKYHASLQQNVNDAVIVTDMDFRIQSWNLAAERIYGWKANEVVNKLANDILQTQYSDIDSYEHRRQTLQEQGWWRGETIQHDKDGSPLYILSSVAVVTDEDDNPFGVVAINHDITRNKQVQQALSASEANLQSVMNSTSVGILLIANDGLIRLYNQVAQDYSRLLYGKTIEQGKTNLSDVGLTKPDFIQEVYQRCEEGERIHVERSRVVNGQTYDLDVHFDPVQTDHGELIGIVISFMDITERKRAETALKKSTEEEREFQTYLKGLHDITIELTQINDLNTFFKRAVEMGLERLGLERLALFLYDEQNGIAKGTYGTDEKGQVTDEHHVSFVPEADGIMSLALNQSERFYFNENKPLYYENKQVGMGWNATAVLWNGTQSLGWIIADNLISQKPATKPLMDILGLYALAIGTILAQKQVRQTLKESEARYRLLAENIIDVVIQTRLDGEFMFVSPSITHMLGFSSAELIGQQSLDIVHPDDQSHVRDTLLGVIKSEDPNYSIISRAKHQKGYYIWLETEGRAIYSAETGKVEGFISSSRDVSDRIHAENSLRKSEEKYRHLIDTMNGGLAVFDIDDKATYVNDRFCEIIGFTSEELIGVRPYDNSLNGAVIQQHMESRRNFISSTYEVSTTHSDGRTVHILISGSPLTDDKGEYNGSVVVITDITAQKQAEETLRQAFEKEKELGELKSRFVSMASHEFRTPLATILALTDTLSAYRHKFSDEQIDTRLEKIKGQIAHLEAIMEDVLMLARMQTRRVQFNPVRLDLDSLCRSVIDEFQSRPDITNPIEYACHVELHDISMDKKLMRQIINNLVSNAVKYSPPDQPISVSLDYKKVDEMVILSVQDQGIGIPESDLPYLFEPFHRASNVGTIPGTGLGLVITKESIELHGGTIKVESQVDKGTTFTIRIPPFSKDSE